jgi:flagellin
MRDLAVQAANGSNDTASLSALQAENNQLVDELDRIADKTTFNNVKLLKGGADLFDKDFQVGYASGDTMKVTIQSGTAGEGFGATDLSVDSLNLSTSAGAAITALDGAITEVSGSRAKLGALQNRFEHTINNLNVAIENLSASESRIRDTDMAQEMVNFTRSQILSQAGTAMLAQANQMPQGVLRLLQ